MEPVGFDIETASASELFSYGEGFMKLAGYTDAATGVSFTSDPAKLIETLEAAPWIYGHGIFTFDLLALAHIYGADWEALTRKAIDTELLDRLDYPPMARDTAGSVDKYDLDHVAARRGVTGKTGDIAEIAKKHGGFDSIPVDDNEYRDYLRGDVDAVKALIGELPFKGNAYAKREHQVASLNGRMTLNGFRVDEALLEKRIAEGEENKRTALEILAHDYDLPLGRFEWSGRAKEKIEKWEPADNPLAALEGRRWLIEVWQAFGINNPPVTDTGRLSTSAQDLRPVAESPATHPDLRQLLELMMTVTTTRTVYQTIADHVVNGRVHPLIVMRQASGRSSVTSPGLTVMGKRGGRHREREVLLPDEGQVLISADLSQVDMRGVAGHCQDPAYMALFGPGKDVHTEIAIQIFGTPDRRHDAKAIGHGANYGLGANRMIANGHNPETVAKFFNGMRDQFPLLMSWREEIREIARSGQYLDNGFGRKMRCDPKRAYTQGPAQMGQGTAADLLKEAMLHLPDEFRSMLRVPVHDELVVSCLKEDAADVSRELEKAMTFEWRGVPITCDVSKPGDNWGEVSAK